MAQVRLLMHFQKITAILIALFSSASASAGSVNSLSAVPTDTTDAPSCDVRRVVLDKCDATVRQHILNKCYVVVQSRTSVDEEFDCTWQSCNGVSLVGSLPSAKLLKNPNVVEFDEYGTKFYGERIPEDWRCTAPKSHDGFNAGTESVECLANVSSQSLFYRDRERKVIFGSFPRAYMTLRDALNLAKQNNQSNELQKKLSQISSSKVLTTNPYLDCALNEKVYVWVVYDVKDYAGKVSRWNTNMQSSPDFPLDQERAGGEYVTVGQEENVCRRLIRNWIPDGADTLNKEFAYCKKGDGGGEIFKTFKKNDRLLLPDEQSSIVATSATPSSTLAPAIMPTAAAIVAPTSAARVTASPVLTPTPANQTCAARVETQTRFKNLSSRSPGGCGLRQNQTRTASCTMMNGRANYGSWSSWTPSTSYRFSSCN